jgi:hypothetical protein
VSISQTVPLGQRSKEAVLKSEVKSPEAEANLGPCLLFLCKIQVFYFEGGEWGREGGHHSYSLSHCDD